MSKQSWYSVRSLFRFDRKQRGKPGRVFEERVVIFRAANFEEAIAKGEAEAKRYRDSLPESKHLGYLLAFSIQETKLQEGQEVWSSMREIDLSDKEFLKRFYKDENGYTEIEPSPKHSHS